jgi:hypothetical protein
VNLRLLVLALGLAALVAAPAGAEPLVRVRAESRIELGVVHLDEGMAISGALRYELGAPLTGRPLAIEAIPLNQPGESWRTQLATDDQGRFALELADAAHDYRLLATFAGDSTHRGVRVERRVERARADVRLELRLPEGHTIDLDAASFAIEAVAESDAGGDAIAMRLWDETGREVARGTTDSEGRLRLTIPTRTLGAPGAGLLRIESLRDERRAEAQTEARVVRRRAVFVSIAPKGSRFEAGSALGVAGSVRTHAAPRSGVPVGLYVGDRHLETVVTDERGRFEAELWIDAAEGPLAVTARAEGDATGAYPATETKLVVQVQPARPVPVAWLGAATLLVLIAIWGLGRLRSPKGLETNGELHAESFASSIRPARAQGRRDRHRVNGRALDLRNDEPVAHAEVALVHEQREGSCTLRTDEYGRFASPVLPPGKARVRVSAEGYVTTETDLELPHRGEWTSFVVRLESLRARALTPFRRLSLRILPSTRAWGIWTTREAREWIAQKVPGDGAELARVTLEVERACYGRELPSEADVAAIEETTRTIEARLGDAEGTRKTGEQRAVR